ncbi:ATP-binding cassette domain-containing protein [Actinacidiphila oryziradicis]|uniref:ABC transporter ATP-binding protein n=1 Tax=Actinacidiphila oryziradicis TaxID=2571141 RepID=A0A4U0SHV8_9ACTN|nr:ABC transporter ATP-binding protein [Actinacidiphila oryziradicis]TJZ99834.1 ABC transporter ATP-binding protein [Actinacidiphila oryziradicis]
MTALQATGLTRRHHRRGPAALDSVDFALPKGSICALVGRNGAGKSTLLELAAGVDRPSVGSLTVLGEPVGAARARVGYLAQDQPLDPNWRISDVLRIGAHLNPGRWDAAYAEGIVKQGGLAPRTRLSALSGGQHTRVALALVLGKRPDLILLDEPMADLDPLARHELTGSLLGHATEHGATVLLSSHHTGELADVCDHLLLLDGGRLRLAGAIDDLLEAHLSVTGPGGVHELSPHTLVTYQRSGRGTAALLRPEGAIPSTWHSTVPTLDELILGYLGSPTAPALYLSPAA